MSQAPVNDTEALLAIREDAGYLQNIDAVNRMMHHGKSLSGHERNCVFLNQGDGKFSTISALSGFDFPDDSRGIALMDWDHDGKMDFWCSNRSAPRIRFMHNTLKHSADWVGFQLQGQGASNRDAIGARVKVTLNSGRVLIRSLRAGEGFASQSTKRLHFGLGENAKISSLSVIWPDGVEESFSTPSKNNYSTLRQGSAQAIVKKVEHPTLSPTPLTLSSPKPSLHLPLRIAIPAPIIRFQSSGDQVSINTGKLKRPLLINLWSQGCSTCRSELEEFTKASNQIQPVLDILALCIDPDATDQKQAGDYLTSIHFPWKAGIPSSASNQVLASIFTHSFPLIKDLPTPSSLLVSSDGKIVALYNGAVTSEKVIYDAKLLAGSGIDQQRRFQIAAPMRGQWITPPQQINLLYIPRLIMEHGTLDDAADYIIRAHQQLLSHKEYPILLTWVAEEYIKKGMTQHAMAFYKTALETGRDNPLILNNIAWQLATHPDASIRNGKEAVKWATRAAQLTNNKDPSYLDTLAAAYAEQGRYGKALRMAQHALQLAKNQKNQALIPGLQKAIVLYGKGMPMR